MSKEKEKPVVYIDDKDLEEGLKLGLVKVKVAPAQVIDLFEALRDSLKRDPIKIGWKP